MIIQSMFPDRAPLLLLPASLLLGEGMDPPLDGLGAVEGLLVGVVPLSAAGMSKPSKTVLHLFPVNPRRHTHAPSKQSDVVELHAGEHCKVLGVHQKEEQVSTDQRQKQHAFLDATLHRVRVARMQLGHTCSMVCSAGR